MDCNITYYNYEKFGSGAVEEWVLVRGPVSYKVGVETLLLSMRLH
jgi:hypothetical protein